MGLDRADARIGHWVNRGGNRLLDACTGIGCQVDLGGGATRTPGAGLHTERTRAEGDDHAVPGPPSGQEAPGHPGVGGSDPFDLVPDGVEVLEVQVDAEAGGQLGSDHPVGPGHTGGRDLLAEAAHPALEVGERTGPLRVGRRRQDHIGPARRFGQEAVNRHHEPGPVDAPLGQGPVRVVRDRVGAQQDQAVHAALGCGGEDAGGVETGPVGQRPAPGMLVPGPPVGQGDPAGQQAGSQAHVEGAVDVGPAQGGKHARSRNAVHQRGCGLGHQGSAAGERRAAEHHDHVGIRAVIFP